MMARKPPPKGYEWHLTVPGVIRRVPSPEDAYRDLRGLLRDNVRGAVSPLDGTAKSAQQTQPKGRK